MKKIVCGLLAALTVFSAGVTALASGFIVSPQENEDNSITFETNSKTFAKLFYKANSDADNFYIGLSTSWSDSDYEKAFSDQDAYLFAFTITPSIPATSIPVLYLYNPFAEEDTEATGKTYVYQIDSTGKLVNVTSKFSSGTDENDKAVLATQTRKPGTYVVTQTKIDTAAWNETYASKSESSKKAGTVKRLPVSN